MKAAWGESTYEVKTGSNIIRRNRLQIQGARHERTSQSEDRQQQRERIPVIPSQDSKRTRSQRQDGTYCNTVLKKEKWKDVGNWSLGSKGIITVLMDWGPSRSRQRAYDWFGPAHNRKSALFDIWESNWSATWRADCLCLSTVWQYAQLC